MEGGTATGAPGAALPIGVVTAVTTGSDALVLLMVGVTVPLLMTLQLTVICGLPGDD